MNNNMKNQNYNKMIQSTCDSFVEMTQDQEEQQQNNSVLFSRSYIQGVLNEVKGYYVIIEFLVGTQQLVEKRGYISDVGINFVTLFDPENKIFIVCDMYSVKFVNITMYKDKGYIEEFKRMLQENTTE